jgi:predicted GIY-YIG superfamily endonuclease
MENNSSSPSAQPATGYYVGMHANARRGPYYFDVAVDTSLLQKNLNKMMATFFRDDKIKLEDCYILIWYEKCESEAAAWARVAEIRALPRAWQRGLIQSMNPHWANLNEIDIGYPGGACVLPEIAGMPFGSYQPIQH